MKTLKVLIGVLAGVILIGCNSTTEPGTAESPLEVWAKGTVYHSEGHVPLQGMVASAYCETCGKSITDQSDGYGITNAEGYYEIKTYDVRGHIGHKGYIQAGMMPPGGELYGQVHYDTFPAPAFTCDITVWTEPTN